MVLVLNHAIVYETIGCSICRYILLAVKLSICVYLRWRSWRIRFVASSQWSQKVLSRQTRAHWAVILKHSIMCFTKTRIYIKHDDISFYQNLYSNYRTDKKLNLDEVSRYSNTSIEHAYILKYVILSIGQSKGNISRLLELSSRFDGP